MLGNGPQVLDNGPYVLGNGQHLLGIMSQFGIMSHSALCRIRDYVVRYYVLWHYVAFGIMSFGIMSHLYLCCSGLSFGVMSLDVMLFSLLSVYLYYVVTLSLSQS